MTEMSPLRRRMIEDMTIRNLSPATQRSYVHAVAKFGRFFVRSPDKLDLEDVRTFQVHLVAGGMSWPALNQTVCALRFLYGVTLKQADLPERIAHAREPQKLPVVLSADEVVRFLEAVSSLKARAALTAAYAAGLRAAEAASLKVADIDSRRMVIRVEQGKSLPLRRRGEAAIVTSCYRRNGSASCDHTGAWHGRRTGSFQVAIPSIRSIPSSCMPPAARPAPPRGLASVSPSIRCATASPPTCWRAAPTSASSRPSSVIATSTPRRATRMWRPVPSAAHRARSTGCDWR